MTTDENIDRLSGRVDELHQGHVELSGRVVSIDDRLSEYIASRSDQLQKDHERRVTC